ncbi:hypothetical protein [Candidatus Poriferisodalis sp.]|uniref:hypothetical protein n=1 Tax=Candidatus Poriferisodalis sp. TaxID=3101277 RepID=UPI003B023BDC
MSRSVANIVGFVVFGFACMACGWALLNVEGGQYEVQSMVLFGALVAATAKAALDCLMRIMDEA